MPDSHSSRSSQNVGSYGDKEADLVRSAGNKYEVIAAWLLEGLASTITRPSWCILSSGRRCTVTDFDLLRVYFTGGYPSAANDAERPYLVPHPNTLYDSTWAHAIFRLTGDRHYWEKTSQFSQDREATDTLSATNRDNPIADTADTAGTEPTSEEEGTSSSSSCSTSNTASSSMRQNVVPTQTKVERNTG